MHFSTFCHDLWDVFRFVDGIINQPFKQGHFDALSNSMRDCHFDQIVLGMSKSDNIIIDSVRVE
jgi:hypothetical protein